MKRNIAASVIAMFSVNVVAFQSLGQSPVGLEFEVANVRVTPQGRTTIAEANDMVQATRRTSETILSGQLHPSGLVTLRNVTMRQLINFAYREIVTDEYLKGGPNWLDSERFDLIAKAPPNTSADMERVMIQTVLVRRFHLAIHREQKSMSVNALVTAKQGPKLKPPANSGDPECGPGQWDGQVHLVCHDATMAFLAQRLPSYVQPVIDMTELKGAYDFQLNWAGRPLGADVAPSPTVLESLDHQLGLKLEPRKSPMPVVVIDHVDRVPSEN